MAECRKYIDRAKKVNPRGIEFTGIEAAYEAKLGHKEKALSLKHDFRTYLILGMNKEAVDEMVKVFVAPPPINFYVSISRSQLMTRVGDDPRFKAIVEKQRAGYEDNKRKFKMPVLPN